MSKKVIKENIMTPDYIEKRKQLLQYTRESLLSKPYEELSALCVDYGIYGGDYRQFQKLN
jgi:hypothetical protein